ncbi:MAG: type II toxin-antitoxin system RelE/ParE family toxin [Spirochaetaceae bacterium]|jgi:hypothetical protein|nr:type II toxin-antitoxin system RelE/ParE family toxin [Spirochaetaceae bacterium]
MRIFKSKWFTRFAIKSCIDDSVLKSAVAEIEAGNFDANLGGFVYKQRVARKGQGKRGGYRTIVLFKRGERAFFVYGFAKSKQDNITEDELAWYKEAAKRCLFGDKNQLDEWLEKAAFNEIL